MLKEIQIGAEEDLRMSLSVQMLTTGWFFAVCVCMQLLALCPSLPQMTQRRCSDG
jgi:hypothetical protein